MALVFASASLAAAWTWGQEPFPSHLGPPPALWTEWPTDFVHHSDGDQWPFHGVAALRLKGRVHLMVGGGVGQSDVLMRLEGGTLVVVEELGEGPTYGIQSIDLDGDEDTDLVLARPEGVVIYWNEEQGLIEDPQDIGCADGVPLGVAVSDVDGDGLADLYLSCFVGHESFRSGVFEDPSHVAKNHLFLGTEQGWTEATEAWQVGGSQNTFLSLFVDLDLDGRQDLVVANNTGRVELYHHDGERFSLTGLDAEGYWMGIAVGDLDTDGDQDLVFTNVGNSLPPALLRGDLAPEKTLEPRWMVVWNEGARRYRAEMLAGLGFGWGVAAGDVDSDGDLDLVAAQNYRKWPLHHLHPLRGKTLLWDGDSYGQAHAGIDNPLFGQSPLWVDLDQDGLEDLVMTNPGSLLRAWRNPGDPMAAVTLKFPDTLDYLGTRVTLRDADGLTPTFEVTANAGFMTDGLADRVVIVRGARHALVEKPSELPLVVDLSR